ncbi:MAG: AlpA family phage regulatory protein [Candidatus Thiodiazotropha endolucinida]|nr:AlpA family phage regulatory protein [Candidatus Thiodiazotropha taylori]MCW4318748.1 AlpA family phage regulatory protein [Candidatus Thiodiazotropha taylori]
MQQSKDLATLPEDALIRIKDVLRLYPISKSGWFKGIQDGKYPKPVKLGERVSAWRVGDILKLVRSVSAEREQNKQGKHTAKDQNTSTDQAA